MVLGEVKIGKIRAVILPLEIIILLYDKIKKRSDEVVAALALYEVGKEIGARIARNMWNVVMENDKALKKVVEVFDMIGLNASLIGGKVIVEGPGAILEDKEGSCHFERGVVAGVLTALTRAPWEATAESREGFCHISPIIRGLKADEEEEVEGIRRRF